jgi:glutamate dehydrogenase
MTAKASSIVEEFTTAPPPVSDEQLVQADELLRWLSDDHFIFLGYREYTLGVDDEGEDVLLADAGTGLGLLRFDQERSGSFGRLPAPVRAKAREKHLLILTKANSRSTVHRPVHLDYVGVKTFGSDGEVIGERRFLGLFTSSAYTESVNRIPVLSRKADQVLAMLGFVPNSHSGKALLDFLETYPRDELFQTSVEQLAAIGEAVLHMHGRRQVRLFVRRDDYGRFLSCVVYLPRDRYTTQVRLRIERILVSAIGGEPTSDYTAWVTESVLARLHFVVRAPAGSVVPVVDVDRIPSCPRCRLRASPRRTRRTSRRGPPWPTSSCSATSTSRAARTRCGCASTRLRPRVSARVAAPSTGSANRCRSRRCCRSSAPWASWWSTSGRTA